MLRSVGRLTVLVLAVMSSPLSLSIEANGCLSLSGGQEGTQRSCRCIVIVSICLLVCRILQFLLVRPLAEAKQC